MKRVTPYVFEFGLILSTMLVSVLGLFPLNDAIRASLDKNKLIEPLTEFVGSMNQPLTFVGS